ncbi:MAG TPA: helix-turn-helix domain-containing protein [Candidatus Saccharimonadales bacterium]
MDVQLLEDIGLTKLQAAAYRALVVSGAATAPTIAKTLGENRTNTYKVLDKLCTLGLASRDPHAKRVMYIPASPAALATLIQERTNKMQLQERKLNAELPGLLDFFFAHSEQPSIRFYQGKEGIKQVYADILATSKTLYLVRSPEDVVFYGEEFFAELRKKRSLLGIQTIGLTPDVPSANHDPTVDLKNKFTRTWIAADAYTANVEWNIAGDKVALISYGKEAMAVVIESAQIAESFRQVFSLAQAARVPWRPASRRPGTQAP